MLLTKTQLFLKFFQESFETPSMSLNLWPQSKVFHNIFAKITPCRKTRQQMESDLTY